MGQMSALDKGAVPTENPSPGGLSALRRGKTAGRAGVLRSGFRQLGPYGVYARRAARTAGDMRRRDVIGVLATCLLVAPRRALAQQSGKMPRIGVLVSASPPHPFADAFRRGLQSFGYTEGQNIRIEFLYTEERADRAAQLAAELVRTGVDTIDAHFTPAIRAAIGATPTIPIVMAPAGAPVQLGCIASLAHPGGT
jgi:ABC transporter substrate binding protein